MTNQQGAPEALTDFEHRHAIRQGYEIAASDRYFEARQQIDSNDRRKVFQAGFERGWDRLAALVEAQQLAPGRQQKEGPTMSFHNKPNYQIPELIEALKAHRLPHDTPSQLADSFRIGWRACRELAQADSQPAPVLDYPPLPRVGAIGYASVVDIESYAKTLTIGPHLPGVRDIALWTTDQMRAYVDADRAARAPADSVTASADGANWQDISTAPKDGTRFVAVGNNYGLYSEAQHTCIAQWFRGCWMEVSDWNEASELAYLTHWMPFTPLPGSAASAPANSVTAPAGGGAVVEWHAPGLGEVHNESHGQLIFCTDGDDVADDTLARRVCAALNATPPAQAADSALEDAERLDWLALAGPTSICVVIDRPNDGEVEVATDDVTGYGKTLREALDAARKQGGV